MNMSKAKQLSKEESVPSNRSEEDKSSGKRGGRKSRRMRSMASHSSPSLDDWSKRESTNLESVEANPRDTLNARVAELEEQLKEMEKSFSALETEAKESRILFQNESDDCRDIVSVAKRNVQQLVQEILERQKSIRNLSTELEAEEDEMRKEEEERKKMFAREEEKLTKNVILLKTQLMILEEKRLERKSLLDKINKAETEISSKLELHECTLEQFRREMQDKYEKLSAILSEHVTAVGDEASRLGLSQQVSALKERQLQILDTQTRYKSMYRLMYTLHQQNKMSKEKMEAINRELDVRSNLAEGLAKLAQRARKVPISEPKNTKIPDGTDISSTELSEKLRQYTLELKKRLFERRDYRKELQTILSDQKDYKRRLDEKEQEQKLLQDKLVSMSQVAQLVIDKDQEETPEAISERSVFLEKMSTILMETAEDSEQIEGLQLDCSRTFQGS